MLFLGDDLGPYLRPDGGFFRVSFFFAVLESGSNYRDHHFTLELFVDDRSKDYIRFRVPLINPCLI